MMRRAGWSVVLAAACAGAVAVASTAGAGSARAEDSAAAAAGVRTFTGEPAAARGSAADRSTGDGGLGASELTGDCLLYFERGHYWIELRLSGPPVAQEGTAPKRTMFEITEVGSRKRFHPSRVELAVDAEENRYIILSSGQLRGKRCYRVVFDPGGPAERTLGSACDPFARRPSAARGGGAIFFARHVAPAFAVSGEEYRFNRLTAKYDLTSEKAATAIDIEPVFELGPGRVTPFFKHDATTYTYPGRPARSVTRRSAGCSAAAAAWIGGVRAGIEGEFASDRRAVSVSGGGEESSLAAAARLIGRVRLDNRFDRVNRHGISVFKGVDIGIGHAWYTPAGAAGWDRFELRAPLVVTRMTWTLLSGVQLSYEAEACRPEAGRSWHAWHRFRARLLLRDALRPPTGRRYHPDLELALDTGRRIPFLEREKSVSLGFTFNLYPW